MMTTPLYKLAENGELPIHQFMDEETANWLYSQARKTSMKYFEFPTSTLQELADIAQNYVPERKEYTHENLSKGIHGQRHAFRVAFYSKLISEVTSTPFHLLALAAKYHDVRRKTDKLDRGHGQRGADYFLKKVQIGAINLLEPGDAQRVYNMIKYHEIDLKNLSDSDEKYRSDIISFKAADALDRARLPNLNWWPSYDHIALIEAHKYVPLALRITSLHEYYSLNQRELAKSMMSTLSEILQ